MKLIITGASGFIGGEVLSLALASPGITSVVALLRRPFTDPKHTANPKLKVVINEDFTTYPPSVLEQLEGAQACIWTVGPKSLDTALIRKVSIGYTLAAARAFASLPNSPKPFRFIYTSGFLTLPPNASGWIYPATRRTGGEAEVTILDFAKQTEGFDAFVTRPASVRKAGKGIMGWVVPSIGVQELSACMLDLAVCGSEKSVWENRELRVRGKELLKIEGESATGNK